MVFDQGRINHCAGCTMGGAPARGGGRSTAKFLPRCYDVWTFSVGLNVTMRQRLKCRQLFGEEKCTPREKEHAQRKSWLYAYEKSPPPEWLILPCIWQMKISHLFGLLSVLYADSYLSRSVFLFIFYVHVLLLWRQLGEYRFQNV